MKKGMMTLVMFLTLPIFADLSANFTFSSNYVWRGMTQTMDKPGYSGGFDYSHESGFYAGTWGSNVAFGGAGLELDTYAGYTGTFEGVIDYDVGYIDYAYPGTSGDFEEFYFSASYEGIGFSYYQPLEGGADYIEAFYSKSSSLGSIRPILLPLRKLLFKFTNPEKSKFEGILLVALSFGSLPEIVLRTTAAS